MGLFIQKERESRSSVPQSVPPIEFNVLGSIQSPGDPKYFKGDSWITFERVNHLTMSGTGDFDGQGTTTWGRSGCSKTQYYIHLPVVSILPYLCVCHG
jgi:hypothetical protein